MNQLFDDTDYATMLTQRERFVAPLMSVLDATQGRWAERKMRWHADYPCFRGAAGRDDARGAYTAEGEEGSASAKIAAAGSPVSVFDPVLAEVAYSWWTVPGSEIYDPFAGGPVRGVVASAMGRRYLGVDVRQQQVDTNDDVAGMLNSARWVCADSSRYSPPPCDFVFTCPPYGSLEQYRGGNRDLSMMSWPDFRDAYAQSVTRAIDALRDDRFAAFVVANYKEKGALRDLVGWTVEACGYAGADYYGDIIYVTPIGTIPMQAEAVFPKNRRPMPRHQFLLLFVKGDQRAAAHYVTQGQDQVP